MKEFYSNVSEPVIGSWTTSCEGRLFNDVVIVLDRVEFHVLARDYAKVWQMREMFAKSQMERYVHKNRDRWKLTLWWPEPAMFYFTMSGSPKVRLIGSDGVSFTVTPRWVDAKRLVYVAASMGAKWVVTRSNEEQKGGAR